MKYFAIALNAAFIFGSNFDRNNSTMPKITSGVIPSEQKDNVLLDGIGLATTRGEAETNENLFNRLKEKGIDISASQNGNKTDYSITTSDSSYELKTLEQMERAGIHAKSYLVRKQLPAQHGKETDDTLRIAFGGTRSKDWGRTFTMHLTKLPLHYEKHLSNLIDKTLDAYRRECPNSELPKKIVVSGYSAGATQANKAFEILKQKGLKSKTYLHLYEPFGAKFSKIAPEYHKDIVSYTSHNSFLRYFAYDGDTIGKKKMLPESDIQRNIAAGKAICLIEGNTLFNAIAASVKGHGLDSIIDSSLQKDDDASPLQPFNLPKNFSETILRQNSSKNNFLS